MTSTPFLSTLHRSSLFKKMEEDFYDVIVIGGGITGAGIALDAASRGLKTTLIEQGDFAQGTSSRSTKLIHGGLRYLKQFEFKLVREVGKERKILLKNAPHLVHPETMLLPVIKNGSYGKFAVSVGLWIYDKLAGVEKEEQRIMLNKKEAMPQEPLLNPHKIKGAGLYYEYRTDDSRLTIEVIKTASEHNADCINYAEANGFIYHKGKVAGVTIDDKIENKNYTLRAKHIINATGPWVDKVGNMDAPAKGKRLYHTKGIHIVVPFSKLPLRQAVYFDIDGGRMLFAIPRGNMIYIGTTDTAYSGDLKEPFVSNEDVTYLLNGVNNFFNGTSLTKSDIISTWAGIRPLIYQEGKSPSEISRKDEVFVSHTGLVSIAGGKLTGYRMMAEKVVNLVMKELEKNDGYNYIPSNTKNIQLTGGKFKDEKAFKNYLAETIVKGAQNGFSDKIISSLVYKYGCNADIIIESVLHAATAEDTEAEKFIKAELWYAINYERATNLNDFLTRRTNMLNFEKEKMEALLPIVINEFIKLLNWDDASCNKYKTLFDEECKKAVNF